MLESLGPCGGLPTLTVIEVPAAESPAQHIRNALMLLSLLKEQSSALWAMNVELSRAAVSATAAVMLLEHHGPAASAAYNTRRAIEALLKADLDWEVIDLIPATVARLFMGWFPLMASAGQN